MKILVINGPNLNMLGIREPEIYGSSNYQSLVSLIDEESKLLNIDVDVWQNNHEGCIVDKIQAAYNVYDGIIINPAAYTHTSVAILDALKAVNIPAIEVHISDVDEREAFRKISYVSTYCFKTIKGEGFKGYTHALQLIKERIEEK
ncbi:MAG: type II 3-dehydroquinate dehydratase [Erysipelotrichaceae bacterium]